MWSVFVCVRVMVFVCVFMCLYFSMQREEREKMNFTSNTSRVHSHLIINVPTFVPVVHYVWFRIIFLCCNFTLTWYYHLAWFQNWISPHFTKESDIGFGHHHAWVFKLRWDHRMDTYIKYDLPDYCLKYKISVTLRVSSPVSLRSQLNAHSVSLLFHFTLNSRLFVSNSLLEIKSTSNYYCRGIHTLYSKNN